MARRVGFFNGEVADARIIAGVIAADNATLTDANYPLTDAIGCSIYDTIFVGVEIAGGTNPTATIEALFRDEEAADGARWKRMLLGARPGVTLAAVANETTGALTGTDFVEVRVFGWSKVYLRVSAVANATSTTSLRILVAPGQRRVS